MSKVIDTKSLMIGNYLVDQKGLILEVLHIRAKKVCCRNIYKENSTTNIKYLEIESDILLKMGFKFIETNDPSIDLYIKNRFEIKHFLNENKFYYDEIELNHVHFLQNLYKLIRGNNLKIIKKTDLEF